MDGEGTGWGSAPPATGRRLEWEAAPAWLRGEVEAWLGARVAGAATQAGGFSPGIAARLRLVDGRRVFVKAVGPEPNPDSPDAHRAEARNMALLPRSAPAPRLLWSLDRRGWVALAFEDVDGTQPTLPWQTGQLRRVLEMVATMAADLTPAPAGACVGAGWVDLLLLLPSVTMQGGPDPEATFAAHPATAGADPRAVTTALTAWAGFLVGGARLPDPPGLPTLRAFQLGQGVVALDWLRRRTGWA
jgi:hypothetical protein